MDEAVAILLIILAVLALPVVAIALAIRAVSRLRELDVRYGLLYERLTRLERGPRPSDAELSQPPAPATHVRYQQIPAPSGVAPSQAVPLRPGPVDWEQVLRPGLEQRLGGNVFVWIGAVALALAGAFLVKYTFDRGLIGPAVRVMLGLAFGMVLLAVGEWLRTRSATIAQGLSAAGIADLFASLLAAVNLYHLIPPLAGFGSMAAVTFLAVVLSLRQGPLVAALGLVGGFLTPVLIRMGEPQPSLFAYLFMLQLGLLAVTRRRRWLPLTVLTLLSGTGWTGWWLVLAFKPEHGVWLGLFLLGSVAAFVTCAQAGHSEQAWGHRRVAAGLSWAATGFGLVSVGALVGVADFSWLEWGFLWLLGVGCLVLARLRPVHEGLAWLAAAVGLALLLGWSLTVKPIDPVRFGATLLPFGALYAAGAYICLWGSPMPIRWASLSVVAAIAYLLLAYFRMDHLPGPLSWGAVCLILAAAYGLATIPVGLRRAASEGMEWTLAVLATGATAMVSLAVPIELERAWIAVAWALEIPALALIAWLFRIDPLRIVALALALLVGGWLVANPNVLHYPIGTRPIVNWLLYGYGVPILALAVGAWLFKERGDDPLVVLLESEAIVLGFALITLQIRQWFHPGSLTSVDFPLIEWGSFSAAWLLYAGGLLLAAARWPRPSLLGCAQIITVAAIIQALAAQGLIRNPLWWHHPVGQTPVWNALLFVFGLPGALAAPLAWRLRRIGQTGLARVAGAFSMLVLFGLLSLEIRQFFQGTYLDQGPTTNAEWYTYSAAWILLGLLLLLLGIAARGVSLRYGSLVVMLLAVGKVFLFDTAQLKDLYRVLSFFGLGLSLMLLAYLYNRFVFVAAATADD